MTTTQPTATVDVIAPLSPALTRMRAMLFQPFDLPKWLAIGFCAWLAFLGEGGMGGSPNFGGGPHFNAPGRQRRLGPALREAFGEAKEYVAQNLDWLLPLAIVLVLVAIAVGILFTWLSSRGRFMFLHCVALNAAQIGVPWTRYGRQGDSLFWFRFVLGLLAWLIAAPLLVLGAVAVLSMIRMGQVTAGGISLALAALLALLAEGFVLVIIHKLTTDFVVPIMFLRQTTTRAGWGELLRLAANNKANLFLYLLFQVVIQLVLGLLVLIVVVVTCCCAGCLLAVPYVGTVLLLPVLVFERAYSACYLAQFGPAYDVFPPDSPPA